MSIEKMLSLISDWSVVLPFSTSIFLLKKQSKNNVIIFLVVALAMIPQLMNAFNLKDESIKNFAYNLYTPLELLCFYFLFEQYIHGKRPRMIYKALLILYLFASIAFITNESFTSRFFDEWACLNNLAYTLWILYIFYQQYSLAEAVIIDTSTSAFWIMIGLLLYASCATLYFSVYHYAQNNNFSSLKIIHHLVNANMYVCFAIAIYKDSRNSKRIESNELNKKVSEKNVVAN